MNSEPELSAEARRMIAAAKGYDDPSSEDRDRVKSRWLASIAAAASVSALGEAARAASTTAWGAKAVGWVVALAAGAAGIYALLGEPSPARVDGSTELETRSGSRSAPQPAEPPPAVVLPVVPPEPAPAPVAPAPVVSAPERGKPGAEGRAATANAVAPAAKPAPPKAPVPAPLATAPAPVDSLEVAAVEDSALPQAEASEVAALVDSEQPETAEALAPTAEASRQLGEETLLLSKVRRSLRAGAAARALEELAEYRQRFEKPLLGMEAAALRVDALCRSGNVAAGRAEAQLFQATWPSSPLERRVRAACQ